jgi:glycosyl transferase, family 25
MKFQDYFDRVAIIHLKHRTDRFGPLVGELRRLGIDITAPRVTIPDAPMPPQANGFPSKGVYGSFLSHLDILKSAHADKLQTVLVLEDDAIFSRRFARERDNIAMFLSKHEWDICFFGHSLTVELAQLELGLPRYSGPFYWAHCYAVHACIMPRLIRYLEETVQRRRGDPLGGKMYIDGAYALFREFNPDAIVLVANPVLSVQRGSPSSLVHGRWYDRVLLVRHAAMGARSLRDEAWRWSGWTFGGAAPRNLDHRA